MNGEWQGTGPIRYINHSCKGWFNKYGQEPYYWVMVERKGPVTAENLDYILAAVEREFVEAKAAFIELLKGEVPRG